MSKIGFSAFIVAGLAFTAPSSASANYGTGNAPISNGSETVPAPDPKLTSHYVYTTKAGEQVDHECGAKIVTINGRDEYQGYFASTIKDPSGEVIIFEHAGRVFTIKNLGEQGARISTYDQDKATGALCIPQNGCISVPPELSAEEAARIDADVIRACKLDIEGDPSREPAPHP